MQCADDTWWDTHTHPHPVCECGQGIPEQVVSHVPSPRRNLEPQPSWFWIQERQPDDGSCVNLVSEAPQPNLSQVDHDTYTSYTCAQAGSTHKHTHLRA